MTLVYLFILIMHFMRFMHRKTVAGGGIHQETKMEPHQVQLFTDLRHFETDEETLWS
jgi:hypothetical protein